MRTKPKVVSIWTIFAIFIAVWLVSVCIIGLSLVHCANCIKIDKPMCPNKKAAVKHRHADDDFGIDWGPQRESH